MIWGSIWLMCELERYYAPPLIGGGIKRCFCLTSDSVAYVGPKSRTERPRKTKIGTKVAHVTRDSDTTFRVKRSRSPGRFGWLLKSLQNLYRRDAILPQTGKNWPKMRSRIWRFAVAPSNAASKNCNIGAQHYNHIRPKVVLENLLPVWLLVRKILFIPSRFWTTCTLDGLSVWFIRLAAPWIAGPVSHIFICLTAHQLSQWVQ